MNRFGHKQLLPLLTLRNSPRTMQWRINYSITQLLEENGGQNRSRVNLGQKHASQELASDASRLQALKERLEWQDERTESMRARSSGASLLFWAVLADDLSSVRDIFDVLVRNGAPLDARTAQGLTPLQLKEKRHGGTIPEIFLRTSRMARTSGRESLSRQKSGN
jgi:hypothetical protein